MEKSNFTPGETVLRDTNINYKKLFKRERIEHLVAAATTTTTAAQLIAATATSLATAAASTATLTSSSN